MFKALPRGYKIILILMFSFFISLLLLYAVSYILGPPSLVKEQNTIYYNAKGEEIGDERGDENRYWVTLDEISPHFLKSILTVEDRHFYHHKGFELKRMIQAALSDLYNLSLKEGASTITQQLARNLYLSHDKTWKRKIKEAFYTIRIEMFYSKDEILEAYLNTIYFGHGAYGIEAASKYFFSKKASDLSLAEASLLASIPKGPQYYSPLNNESLTKSRQRQILNLLHKNEEITKQEAYLAFREHLTYTKEREPFDQFGPYFKDTVLNEASHILKMKPQLIRSGGFHIYTTMDVEKQKELEKTIAQVIAPDREIQVGAIAMDQATGAIEALVGGQDYAKSPFNRATMAKRMPGSTFKPFLYYTALHHNYTPSTRLVSQPTSFVLADEEVYAPTNYNGYYANKPITLSQALAVSDNIYAVKTNLFLGLETLPKMANNFGFQEKMPAIPSLALGTATVTVKEMATGFSRLANGGLAVEGYTILKIVDRQGKTIYERQNEAFEQVLNPQKAFIITHLLTGMFDEGLESYAPVTGASIAHKLSQTYAGKSGTTPYDHWMIGYSPKLTTAVWVGYDDHRAITSASKSHYAKEIWAQFMEAVHEEKAEFIVPAGIEHVTADPTTGYLATPYCPIQRTMYYEEGTAPKRPCPIHFPSSEELIQEEKKPKSKDRNLFERLFDLFKQ